MRRAGGGEQMPFDMRVLVSKGWQHDASVADGAMPAGNAPFRP